MLNPKKTAGKEQQSAWCECTGPKNGIRTTDPIVAASVDAAQTNSAKLKEQLKENDVLFVYNPVHHALGSCARPPESRPSRSTEQENRETEAPLVIAQIHTRHAG